MPHEYLTVDGEPGLNGKPANFANMKVHRRGPWKTREAVELATLEWVSWFNHHRLLEPIGYIPPAEAEANYWRQQAQASAPTKLAEPAAPQEG